MLLRHLIVLIIDARNRTPFRLLNGKEKVIGHSLIGQIKLTRIHVLLLSLPGVRVKQAAKHLFTMSKDPAAPSMNDGAAKLALFVATLLKWWSRTGSNRRPEACKATALPTELRPLGWLANRLSPGLVGPGRLELPTSRLSGVRSNHLSYGPSGSRQRAGNRAGERQADARADA